MGAADAEEAASGQTEPSLAAPADAAEVPEEAAPADAAEAPADTSPANAAEAPTEAAPAAAAEAPSVVADPVAAGAEVSNASGKAVAMANDNMQIYKEALLRIDAQLGNVPTVRMIADKLHIPPLAVAATGCTSLVAFCLWGFCGQLVSTMLGMILPAYESFKCVEAFSNISDPSEIYAKASSMQFWLIYWIVVAVFASCEYLLYWVLAWMPFYYPIKLVVLLWLWLPQTKGANYMYHWAVAPIVRRNRRHIDAALEESGRHIKQTVEGAVSNMGKVGLQASAGGLGQLSRTVSNVVPELGGIIVRRLVPGPKNDTKPDNSNSD